MAVPRAGRDACWNALITELRLPFEGSATELRSAGLLLVPFWRHADETKRSVSRSGVVVSAADLTPTGLPSLSLARRRVRGLAVEQTTRTGDGMGRLAEGAPPLDATVVDVMLQPGPPPPGAAAASEWRLVYYPVWSFHYVVFSKEHYHAVDAITAVPIGPARRINWPLIATLTLATMLAAFAVAQPLTGAAAALPAWIAALAVMRALIRWERA